MNSPNNSIDLIKELSLDGASTRKMSHGSVALATLFI